MTPAITTGYSSSYLNQNLFNSALHAENFDVVWCQYERMSKTQTPASEQREWTGRNMGLNGKYTHTTHFTHRTRHSYSSSTTATQTHFIESICNTESQCSCHIVMYLHWKPHSALYSKSIKYIRTKPIFCLIMVIVWVVSKGAVAK